MTAGDFLKRQAITRKTIFTALSMQYFRHNSPAKRQGFVLP